MEFCGGVGDDGEGEVGGPGEGLCGAGGIKISGRGQGKGVAFFVGGFDDLGGGTVTVEGEGGVEVGGELEGEFAGGVSVGRHCTSEFHSFDLLDAGDGDEECAEVGGGAVVAGESGGEGDFVAGTDGADAQAPAGLAGEFAEDGPVGLIDEVEGDLRLGDAVVGFGFHGIWGSARQLFQRRGQRGVVEVEADERRLGHVGSGRLGRPSGRSNEDKHSDDEATALGHGMRLPW